MDILPETVTKYSRHMVWIVVLFLSAKDLPPGVCIQTTPRQREKSTALAHLLKQDVPESELAGPVLELMKALVLTQYTDKAAVDNIAEFYLLLSCLQPDGHFSRRDAPSLCSIMKWCFVAIAILHTDSLEPDAE
jgi:hypothetical protein